MWFWINIAVVFICTRTAIDQIRQRSDTWAAFSITAVLLNLAALIVNRIN